MTLPGGAMPMAERLQMAMACIPAALAGLAVIIGFNLLLFGVFAFNSIGSGGVLWLWLAVVAFATLFVLIALILGMALIVVSGRHALTHPRLFAALAVGMILTPTLFMSLSPGGLLTTLVLALPGMFVSFLVLARALERRAAERADP